MTRIVFMGTPDFSVPILRNLILEGYDVIGVVTQPDRPKGRKKEMTPPPVKIEALKHGIAVLQPEKISDEAEMEKMFAFEPDLIVTAAFGQLLPKAVLDYPKYGCINVHASLLPELRGGAPIHYSILQGKKETGVTIMYMAQKLDAGDIISQRKVAIEENDHVGTLHDKLSEVGTNLLLDTIPKILDQSIQPIKQNDALATFAANIKREQEKIDWCKSGEEIYNHIRGLHPWPVAFTTYKDNVMKVWWGEKTIFSSSESAGTIVKIEDDGFVVKTGNDTAIKITDLQPAGKKRIQASEFLRGAGASLHIGEKLGE